MGRVDEASSLGWCVVCEASGFGDWLFHDRKILSDYFVNSVDICCVMTKMYNMTTTQDTTVIDQFIHALTEEMADAPFDIYETTSLKATINDDEFTDIMAQWIGAQIDVTVAYHVYADEPYNDYWEYYPIVDGTVTYEGVTYKFHANVWNSEGDMCEVVR